jgi:hypothetical protein
MGDRGPATPDEQFPNRISEDTLAADDDLLKIFGFDGSEGHGDPLNVRLRTPKPHTSELCSLGEVKWKRLGRVYVRER